jgi:hypothetical protein
MAFARPKLLCPLCGADDVNIVEERGNEERGDDGPAYVIVTVHTNGDECDRQSGTISEALWRSYLTRGVSCRA